MHRNGQKKEGTTELGCSFLYYYMSVLLVMILMAKQQRTNL